jgi:hypothetical protein
MAAIHDPALLADVKRAKLELEPLSGADLQAAITGGGELSPAMIERARQVAEAKK